MIKILLHGTFWFQYISERWEFTYLIIVQIRVWNYNKHQQKLKKKLSNKCFNIGRDRRKQETQNAVIWEEHNTNAKSGCLKVLRNLWTYIKVNSGGIMAFLKLHPPPCEQTGDNKINRR